MLNNKIITITGGTGSFGNASIPILIKEIQPKEIRIFSRDEMKQWDMSLKFKKLKKLSFIIGDVRDKESLNKVFRDTDFVIHAAATKIVPTAEYNPSECIKTNINGAINVIEAAINNNVKNVVALSTDKACNPINLYGATKLCSDKLFVTSNFSSKKQITKFSVVRYGNVMGSRGSVIPFFLSNINENFFTITDVRMTRFMIDLDTAVKTVIFALKDSIGGEIFVTKIPSMKVLDIAKTIAMKKIKIIGIRPGEKLHEQMISVEDSRYTYEYKDYYKILPAIFDIYKNKKYIKNGRKVSQNFEYSSNTNNKWLTKTDLQKWLRKNISSKF
jgi:UDP-N-acetylglucosamine 4,6-dehydratase (inverting)